MVVIDVPQEQLDEAEKIQEYASSFSTDPAIRFFVKYAAGLTLIAYSALAMVALPWVMSCASEGSWESLAVFGAVVFGPFVVGSVLDVAFEAIWRLVVRK